MEGYIGRHSRDPRTELESKELREALNEALQKLPPRLATVYRLYESESLERSRNLQGVTNLRAQSLDHSAPGSKTSAANTFSLAVN